jgi:activating signal cointegrator complex subunit 2
MFIDSNFIISSLITNIHDRTITVDRKKSHDLAPHSTPPQIPERHNTFDDDELDRLDLDMSKLHFGKRNPGKTADDILKDRSTAPNKAAILSALAAFDSDDDERDDTYDAADVGGTVDSTQNTEADGVKDDKEEILFRAYQADRKAFDRDTATRRGAPRARLKEETGMTDETIEGWAVMLGRNPQQLRRLEGKYGTFTGAQLEVPSTAWRASPATSGGEESDPDGGNSYPRGRGGGVPGRGRGRGRGGNVAGLAGDRDTEQARRRKEANKGSRANHNRREGRARKMARGGFPG